MANSELEMTILSAIFNLEDFLNSFDAFNIQIHHPKALLLLTIALNFQILSTLR